MRAHRESQLGRTYYRRRRKSDCNLRPLTVRHQIAVKIPGQERYITVSKTTRESHLLIQP